MTDAKDCAIICLATALRGFRPLNPSEDEVFQEALSRADPSGIYQTAEALSQASGAPIEVCRMMFAMAADATGVRELRGSASSRQFHRKRAAIIWAARKHTDASYSDIAKALNRDAANIHRARNAAERLRRTDRNFRTMCDGLRAVVDAGSVALIATRKQCRS